MNKLITPVVITSLVLLLSACSDAPSIPGVKLQVEPTLPVPILIVPDHGTDSTNSNQNTAPNNNQNAPYQGNNPPPRKNPRRYKPNNNGGNNGNPQYQDNGYPDYQNRN